MAQAVGGPASIPVHSMRFVVDEVALGERFSSNISVFLSLCHYITAS